MKRILLALALTGLVGAVMATDAPSLPVVKAPADAAVYIISPSDGAGVGQEFTVRFGLKGMGVAPAGVAREYTGHHHLHFGGGQTEALLKLKHGTHTLQLELGDENHIPFDPPLVSKRITIHVK